MYFKYFYEAYISALSEEKYSYSTILKRCDNYGIKISKRKISSIIENCQ